MISSVITSIALLLLIILFGVIIYVSFRDEPGTPDDFVNNLAILNAIIQTEIDVYDNDIFERKGGLTNQEFENYLDLITKDITNKLSDNFIKLLSKYWTTAAIYEYVVRRVKAYLIEQVYVPASNPYETTSKEEEE